MRIRWAIRSRGSASQKRTTCSKRRPGASGLYKQRTEEPRISGLIVDAIREWGVAAVLGVGQAGRAGRAAHHAREALGRAELRAARGGAFPNLEVASAVDHLRVEVHGERIRARAHRISAHDGFVAVRGARTAAACPAARAAD